MEQLIKFWEEFDNAKAPYVHPQDEAMLRHKGVIARAYAHRFNDYLKTEHFGFENSVFNLALRPTPYIGNLRAAKVFILLLNPGFSLPDLWAEERPEFRKAHHKNLRQDFGDDKFPFFMLNPEFCWHDSYRWWEQKLRDVIKKIAKEKFQGKYYDALRYAANRIAAIELVPYASAHFRGASWLNHLPSVQMAIAAVQRLHSNSDAKQGKCIVVARQAKAWQLVDGANVCVYGRQEARAAHLTYDSKGGKRIYQTLTS